MVEAEVSALDISDLLGNVRNRVARVGVELEGAWKTLPEGVLGLEHDGSVFADRKPSGHIVGELPIGPAPPAGIPALMRKNYPSKVNHTCGMHVHMSFETLRFYQWLMIPEYEETMAKFLSNWATAEKFKPEHHIWSRIMGEARYCKKGFWPDLQAAQKRKDHNQDRPGNRYTRIHYCGRLLTIECRILPMVPTVEQAIRGVKTVLNITNACLYKLGKENKERKITNVLKLDNDSIYEEFVEDVL